jgi:hypothetical protein
MTGAGWRWRLVLAEAVSNARANLGRSLITVVFLATAVAMVVRVEAEAVAHDLAAEQMLRAAGENVFVVAPVTPADGPLVDAAKCASLNRYPQVVAAGGLLEMGFVALSDAPGTPLFAAGATGRLTDVLDPTAAIERGDGAISVAAAEQVGIGDGELVDVLAHVSRVHRFQPSPRHPRGDLLVVLPVFAEKVDQCWFETEAGATTSAASIARTLFSDNPQLGAGPLLEADQLAFDPLADFTQRQSHPLWLVVGAALGLALLLKVWMERTAISVYRLCRATPLQAALALYLELLLVAVLAYEIGTIAGLLFVTGESHVALWYGVAAGTATVCTALAIVPVALLVASHSSLLAQLKDR